MTGRRRKFLSVYFFSMPTGPPWPSRPPAVPPTVPSGGAVGWSPHVQAVAVQALRAHAELQVLALVAMLSFYVQHLPNMDDPDSGSTFSFTSGSMFAASGSDHYQAAHGPAHAVLQLHLVLENSLLHGVLLASGTRHVNVGVRCGGQPIMAGPVLWPLYFTSALAPVFVATALASVMPSNLAIALATQTCILQNGWSAVVPHPKNTFISQVFWAHPGSLCHPHLPKEFASQQHVFWDIRVHQNSPSDVSNPAAPPKPFPKLAAPGLAACFPPRAQPEKAPCCQDCALSFSDQMFPHRVLALNQSHSQQLLSEPKTCMSSAFDFTNLQPGKGPGQNPTWKESSKTPPACQTTNQARPETAAADRGWRMAGKRGNLVLLRTDTSRAPLSGAPLSVYPWPGKNFPGLLGGHQHPRRPRKNTPGLMGYCQPPRRPGKNSSGPLGSHRPPRRAGKNTPASWAITGPPAGPEKIPPASWAAASPPAGPEKCPGTTWPPASLPARPEKNPGTTWPPVSLRAGPEKIPGASWPAASLPAGLGKIPGAFRPAAILPAGPEKIPGTPGPAATMSPGPGKIHGDSRPASRSPAGPEKIPWASWHAASPPAGPEQMPGASWPTASLAAGPEKIPGAPWPSANPGAGPGIIRGASRPAASPLTGAVTTPKTFWAAASPPAGPEEVPGAIALLPKAGARSGAEKPEPTFQLEGEHRSPPRPKPQTTYLSWYASPRSGRGSCLLTCGDVESNPGPAKKTARPTQRALEPPARHVEPQEADTIDLAHLPWDGAPDPSLVVTPAGNEVILRSTAQEPPAPPGPPLCKCPVDILQLLQLRVPIIRHIPGRALRAFVETLAWAIDQYCSDPNDDTLFGALGLPKLCLRTTPARGKHAASEVESAILHRLELFRQGHWFTLWGDAAKERAQLDLVIETRGQKRARQDGPHQHIDPGALRRVRTLVGEGAPAKAIQSLLSEGLLQAADPQTVRKLEALHPAGNPVHTQSIPFVVEPFDSPASCPWETLVRDALGRFHRTSAPGPSGLRPCHLQEACKRPGRGSPLLQALARLSRLWIMGTLPQEHAPAWCGATLVPLAKKDGGVRPIAVGDTCRRLVGKVLLATPTAKAETDRLRPLQVGVGVPKAAECVAMGVQATATALSGGTQWACLQVDWSNAFNTIDRTALLNACIRRMPSAYNYLRFAYAGQVPLYLGDRMLPSRRGTHQGCPLGPLGFALGLQDIAEKVQKTCGLEWSVWYLDDGVLLGSPQQIQAALTLLEKEGADIGLQLNRTKCVLWGPAAHLVPEHASVQTRSWGEGEGITVLGIPIDRPGHSSMVESAWESASEKLEKLLTLLERIPDPQVCHHLLRACADGCRLNHLLRGADTYVISEAVAESHEAILTAFMTLSGTALSPEQRIQCALPIRTGGCGIKGTALLQPAARISAVAGFLSTGGRRVGAPTFALAPEMTDTACVLEDLSSRLGPNFDPLTQWIGNPSLVSTADSTHCAQSWWSAAIGKSTLDHLIDNARPRDQARLLEQRNGIGTTWMTALPACGSAGIIHPDQYVLGLKWWLGVPLLTTAGSRCPGCGQDANPEGDHFLCCPRNNYAKRHDAVQDAIFNILSTSGLAVAREVALPSDQEARLRPADLLLNNWLNGQPLAVDVTVSHNWPPGNSASPARDNWRPGLRRKEASKHMKYDEPCRNDGWGFRAIALGTWGGLGPEGAKTLAQIIKRATSWESPDTKGLMQKMHYETIGLALFRQIWALLEAKNYVT